MDAQTALNIIMEAASKGTYNLAEKEAIKQALQICSQIQFTSPSEDTKEQDESNNSQKEG